MVGMDASRLQQVLVEWRKAEREHAKAVLCSAHPSRIRELSDYEQIALHHVRMIVDSEPWADLANGY